MILLLLALQAPLWPQIWEDDRYNLFVHDMAHSLTAVAVAEAMPLWTGEVSLAKRYALATVALPIAQEIYDVIRWNVVPGRWPIGWQDKWHDLVTYQAAWSVYFVRRGQYHWAALVLVSVVSFTWYWNAEGWRP